MPSGRTHDIFTFVLIPPSFIASQLYWGDLALSATASAAMAFAGLMFGPDLDIHSVQYKRWGPVRFIWYPYRAAISHRSRLSHGLLFSTIFRLLYFLVVILLISTAVLYLHNLYFAGQETTWLTEFQRVSDELASIWHQTDKQFMKAGFIGLWAGAAAHTIIDVINSIRKLIWKAL